MFRHSSRAVRGKKDRAITPKCRHLANSAKNRNQVQSCKTRLSRKTGQLQQQQPEQSQPQKRPQSPSRKARAGVVVKGMSGVLSCKDCPGGLLATSTPPLHPLSLVRWKRELARAEASANFRKRAAAKLEEEGVHRVLADALEELEAIGARLRDLAPQAALRMAHGEGPEDGSEEAELLDGRRMLTALVRVSAGFKARRLEEEARQVVAEVNAHARTARAEQLRREREALDDSKRREARQMPTDSPGSKQTSMSSPEARPGAMPTRIAAGGC